MEDTERKLEAALMVYDVTLKMVLSLSAVPEFDFLRSQIEAARNAYVWATGEESMVPSQTAPQSLSQDHNDGW